MNKKLFTPSLFLILLFVTNITNGQQSIKTAIKQFELGRYDLAVENFEKALTQNPNDAISISYQANCYYELNNLEKAAAIFQHLILNNVASLDDKLNYASVLTKLGKYNEAEVVYTNAALDNPNMVLPRLNNLAMINDCLNLADDYNILALNDNTKFPDFAFASFDGESFISTYRSDVLLPINQALTINQEESFITYRINNGNLNPFWDGMQTKANKGFVSKCSGTDYFAFSETNFATPLSLNFSGLTSSIYFGKDNGSQIDEIPFEHNEAGVVNAFPFLTNEGNTLYFTSNRYGGFGGFDLYYSIRKNGVWESPVNLGSAINTAGNELSSFISEGVLYFASDNHMTFGGYDILSARSNGGKWDNVENLGKSINSSGDDYFPFFKNDILYFTSNRAGGSGAEDIYEATPIAKVDYSFVPPAILLPQYSSENMTDPNISLVSNKSVIKVLDAGESNEMFSLEGAKLVSIGELLPVTSVYFIQLAALYNSKGNPYEFKRLAKYGNIYKIFQGNVVKIQLGYYYDEAQAIQILEEVKALGYKDAFITYIPLNTAQLELMISSPSKGTNSSTSGKYDEESNFNYDVVVENTYKVRLASYEDPIWFDTNKIQDLGQIEQWSKGKWTIFILGGYKNYESAKKAQIKAVNRGFVDSEIVIDRGGVLERLKKN